MRILFWRRKKEVIDRNALDIEYMKTKARMRKSKDLFIVSVGGTGGTGEGGGAGGSQFFDNDIGEKFRIEVIGAGGGGGSGKWVKKFEDKDEWDTFVLKKGNK